LDDVVPGFLYPESAEERFSSVFKAHNLVVSQLLSLATLLTFGIASPPLQVTTGIMMISELYFNEIFLGRYVLRNKEASGSVDKCIMTSLEPCCVLTMNAPKYTLWIILHTSALITGFVIFDIAHDVMPLGDAVGYGSIPLCITIFLAILAVTKYIDMFLPDLLVARLGMITFKASKYKLERSGGELQLEKTKSTNCNGNNCVDAPVTVNVSGAAEIVVAENPMIVGQA
jgi:hypothetical protein